MPAAAGGARRLAFACVCTIVLLHAIALGSAPARPQSSSVAGLIESYSDWLAGRIPSVDLSAVDLDAARRELGRIDPGSLPARPRATESETREFRRRLLASFALEVAAVGSRRQAEGAARLVEWACQIVRSHSPMDEFDYAWQLAALAVLEGGIHSQVLADHIEHLELHSGAEPRLALARGIADEQFNAPSEVLVRTETAAGFARAREALAHAEGEEFRAAQRALVHFAAAAKHESVLGEAGLRAGHVQLRIGRPDAALAAWSNLESAMDDPALLFLLHLFRGQALEARGRIDEARYSYLQALKISPGAHSATLRLAALGFQFDHSDTPARLVRDLLASDDARRDPWWSYYAGDWRFWYVRIEAVRNLVRAHD